VLISAKIAVVTFLTAMLMALCTTAPLKHEPVKHEPVKHHKKHQLAKKSQVVGKNRESILIDTYNPPLDVLPPPPPLPKPTPSEVVIVAPVTPEGATIIPPKEYRTYLHKNPPWSPNYKKPHD